MPAPKAILRDITEFGLDANEAHSSLAHSGRLKRRVTETSCAQEPVVQPDACEVVTDDTQCIKETVDESQQRQSTVDDTSSTEPVEEVQHVEIVESVMTQDEDNVVERSVVDDQKPVTVKSNRRSKHRS